METFEHSKMMRNAAQRTATLRSCKIIAVGFIVEVHAFFINGGTASPIAAGCAGAVAFVIAVIAADMYLRIG